MVDFGDTTRGQHAKIRNMSFIFEIYRLETAIMEAAINSSVKPSIFSFSQLK